MSQFEPDHLICWNCNQKTPNIKETDRKCVHCGAEISTADELYGKKGEKKIKVIIQLNTKSETINIDLDDLKVIIEEEMNIIQVITQPVPFFIVNQKDETADLDEIFDRLYENLGDFQEGLILGMNRIARSPNLVINLIYSPKIESPSNKRNLILMGLTFLTLVLSGIYNYSQIRLSSDLELAGWTLYNTSFNIDSLIFGLQFAGILISILMIKDYQSIINYFRKTESSIGSYFIPALPVFELGTLGSVIRHNKLPKNNKELLRKVGYGAIIAWIVSVVIFFLTLELGKNDPNAAIRYQNHSIMLNGRIEPLLLRLIELGSDILNIPIVTGTISNTIILHPITMAALAGIYIVGFNLLPAAYFNGGYITRAVYGKKVHSVLTYVVIFAFIFAGLIYIPFILLFMNRSLRAPFVLNSATPVEPRQKYIFVIMMIMSILSFPIPL